MLSIVVILIEQKTGINYLNWKTSPVIAGAVLLIVTLLAVAGVTLRLQPFRRPHHNGLEVTGLASSVCLLLAGVLFQGGSFVEREIPITMTVFSFGICSYPAIVLMEAIRDLRSVSAERHAINSIGDRCLEDHRRMVTIALHIQRATNLPSVTSPDGPVAPSTSTCIVINSSMRLTSERKRNSEPVYGDIFFYNFMLPKDGDDRLAPIDINFSVVHSHRSKHYSQSLEIGASQLRIEPKLPSQPGVPWRFKAKLRLLKAGSTSSRGFLHVMVQGFRNTEPERLRSLTRSSLIVDKLSHLSGRLATRRQQDSKIRGLDLGVEDEDEAGPPVFDNPMHVSTGNSLARSRTLSAEAMAASETISMAKTAGELASTSNCFELHALRAWLDGKDGDTSRRDDEEGQKPPLDGESDRFYQILKCSLHSFVSTTSATSTLSNIMVAQFYRCSFVSQYTTEGHHIMGHHILEHKQTDVPRLLIIILFSSISANYCALIDFSCCAGLCQSRFPNSSIF